MTESDAQTGSPRRWRFAALVAALAGALLLTWYLRPREDALPAGVTADQYAMAQQRFQELYGESDPDRMDVLSLLAELLVAQEQLEAAVACFREIPSDHPRYGLMSRLNEGELLVRLRRADEAEASLRQFLTLAPRAGTVPAEFAHSGYKWLTFLLSVQIRLEERWEVLAEQHRYGLADVLDSKQYCFPNLLNLNSPVGRTRLSEFLEEDPENPRLQLALGRYRTLEGRLDEAQGLLEELYQQHPEDRAVAAAVLEAYYEAEAWEPFAEVIATLPEGLPDDPWLLGRMRGEFALQQQRWQDAVDHFLRVLEKEPAYLPCHMGLARAYGELGDATARQQALERAGGLAEIRVELGNVQPGEAEAMRKLSAQCEAVGLEEAAEIFRLHALAQQPN